MRYVIEGSVRWAGDRVRVNVQLTDAETEAHRWADRFDIDPANFPQAQNDILGPVALTVHLRLLKAAGQRIEQEAALDPVPEDLFIRGLALFARATTAAGLQEALQEDLTRAEPLLIQAMEQDPNNFRVRTALGFLRRLQNRLDESLVELEKAVALAPHHPDPFWMLGTTLITLGEPEAAIAAIEKGLRLYAPGSAIPIPYTVLTVSYLLLGRVEAAIETARRACADNPRLYFTHMLLAAALGLKGNIGKANAALPKR